MVLLVAYFFKVVDFRYLRTREPIVNESGRISSCKPKP
jgi:hypothetical protein